MSRELIDGLRQGHPFRDMSEADFAWLAGRLAQHRFPEKTPIIESGGASSGLYFVVRGTVRIEGEKDGRVLAELVPGECFPLEALAEQTRLGTHFRSGPDCICLELSEADIRELRERSPVFAAFCQERAEAMRVHTFNRRAAPLAAAPQTDEALARPLSALAGEPPLTVLRSDSLAVALKRMQDADGRTCLVVNAYGEMVGSYSLRDLLANAVGKGVDGGASIASVMAPPLPALPADAPAFAAAALMGERACPEIVVLDQGKPLALVHESQLFETNELSGGEIARRLRRAATRDAWVGIAALIQRYSRQLVAQGVAASRVTRLVSDLSDQLAARIVGSRLAAAELPAGTRWAWLVFGSEGRHEQTLVTDQDNGLVFDCAKGDCEAVRERLLAVAGEINAILADCGYALCKGGIMAGHPDCCHSLHEWEDKFHRWIEIPEPNALLHASIFFDFRCLTGSAELATTLHTLLAKHAPQNRRFQLLLAGMATDRTPPIGFFRDFRTDSDGTIDLKLGASAIFVDTARLYALANGITDCSTEARLERLAAFGHLDEREVVAWRNAFAFVQTLRLRAQNDALANGREASNRVAPAALNELDRRFLLESLRQAARMQKRIQLDFPAV